MAASGHTTCVTRRSRASHPDRSPTGRGDPGRCVPGSPGCHFSRCGTLGCTILILTPGTISAVAMASRAWPARAASRRGSTAIASADRLAVRPAEPVRGLAPQHRRQREDDHRAQRQAVDAEHRRALHQGQRVGQRVAEHVPGKAGQHMATQPFRRRQSQCQRQHAARTQASRHARQAPCLPRRTAPGRPAAASRQTAAARRTSRPRRGRPRRSRTARTGNSRSRTTSRPRLPSREWRASPCRRLGDGPVDQPDQRGKRDPQHRPGEERRHRQHRQGPGGESGPAPAPAAKALHARRQRSDELFSAHGSPRSRKAANSAPSAAAVKP